MSSMTREMLEAMLIEAEENLQLSCGNADVQTWLEEIGYLERLLQVV